MPQAHRLLTFNFKNLQVNSPVAQNPVDITLGRVFCYLDGVLVYPDVNDNPAVIVPQGHGLLRLTFDYNVKDRYEGFHDQSSEVLVHRATLKAVQFHDADLQSKFGHLLTPEIAQARRASSRGENLQSLKGKRNYTVVRAMDSLSHHAHSMDYVYLTEVGAIGRAAQRVVQAYENGDELRSHMDRTLMATLAHAVTTAIYEASPQHVCVGVAASSKLFRASNEGEYFYDSIEPLPMHSLITVNAMGEISLTQPPKPKEPESQAPVALLEG